MVYHWSGSWLREVVPNLFFFSFFVLWWGGGALSNCKLQGGLAFARACAGGAIETRLVQYQMPSIYQCSSRYPRWLRQFTSKRGTLYFLSNMCLCWQGRTARQSLIRQVQDCCAAGRQSARGVYGNCVELIYVLLTTWVVSENGGNTVVDRYWDCGVRTNAEFLAQWLTVFKTIAGRLVSGKVSRLPRGSSGGGVW